MVIPAGQSNAGTYYYHVDGLGSVVALSNESGSIVERYVYDVFGAVTVCDASGTPRSGNESLYENPYMFTGRRFDPETQTTNHAGLYYYRARYYKPDIGRFLQPDSIGYDDGMNMYTYVGNNPVVWIDPWGEKITVRETFMASVFAGPIDALNAALTGYVIEKWAKAKSQRLVPISENKGCEQQRSVERRQVKNALQHAAWSAHLYRTLPNNDAQQILHIHEQFGEHAYGRTDTKIDFWNNEVGRRISLEDGFIFRNVEKAYREGRLTVTWADVKRRELYGNDITWSIGGQPERPQPPLFGPPSDTTPDCFPMKF